MNGSRLKEHRKSRVPFWHWVVVIGLMAILFALSEQIASGYEPYVEDTGVVKANSEICFALEIDKEVIKLLQTYQYLVNALEAFQNGGPPMHPEEALVGKYIYESGICATTAEDYMVDIFRSSQGYSLVNFDPQYGFETSTFIVSDIDLLHDGK